MARLAAYRSLTAALVLTTGSASHKDRGPCDRADYRTSFMDNMTGSMAC